MVQMDMRGVADDMRVSLLCLLLLFGRWNLLLYGALANPYHHGKYEDGSTVYGSGPELHNPERYSGLDQKFKIQQSNLASNKQHSTKLSSKVKFRISPSHYELGLPEHHQNPVSKSTSLDGPSMFQHPSRNTEIAQIGLAFSVGERIPQDSSQGMNNIYTPERSQHARFKSAAGGFTQNAPGSLYPSNPSETIVHTVPYFSISRKYPTHEQLQNNLAQRSTHFTEPGRSYPVSPIGDLGSHFVGHKDNTQSMTYDPSLQDINSDAKYVPPSSVSLAPTSSNAGYHERNASKLIQDQDAPVNGKWAFQRLVSSNGVPIQSVSSWSYGGQRPNNKMFGSSHRPPAHPGGSDFDMSYLPQRDEAPNQKIFTQPAKIRPASHINCPSQVDGSIDSLKNWATTDEDQVSELHPFTEDPTSQNSPEEPPRVGKSPTVETEDASSGSARGDADLHQSFEGRHKALTDRKRLIQLRPQTRYLVRAFNHYEQGRLYQSRGRNNSTEMAFLPDGPTLRLRVQSNENPRNGHRR
ncbi:uncharacterized protein LOC121688334 [Alosa sapidissima]|uniref:uncharacterized protein LOC121688334 n=1 Tax=Alosa sapidissima TaxID=34773 RepID=UPI001C0976E7|nr:uncharacterized protein LOC121688334 [Alosa sapidissima]